MIGVFVAHKSNKISGNIRIGRNVFPKKAFAVSGLSSGGLISRRHAAVPPADELIGSAADGTKVFVADRYRLCGDGERDGFLVPSGRSTGSSLLLSAASLLRSSDAVDAGGPLSGMVEFGDRKVYGFRQRYESGRFDAGAVRPCEMTFRPLYILRSSAPNIRGTAPFGGSSIQGSRRAALPFSFPRNAPQRMEFIRMLALTSASARMRAISTSLSAW